MRAMRCVPRRVVVCRAIPIPMIFNRIHSIPALVPALSTSDFGFEDRFDDSLPLKWARDCPFRDARSKTKTALFQTHLKIIYSIYKSG